MKKEPTEASPFKSAREELDHLRRILRETVDVFASRLEGEIVRLRETISEEEGQRRRPSSSQLSDMRDVTGLLRSLRIKPEKGRRRDLKKLESAVEDVQQILENW